MENIQAVNENVLPITKMWNGQRVVSLSDIDKVHQRIDGTAKKNFQNNRKHFVINEDYFELTREELRTKFSPNSEPLKGNPKLKTYLFTESGYLMVVKSFTDDLSWEVQRKLVNEYFKSKEEKAQQQAIPEQKKMLLKNPQTWFTKNNWKMQFICDEMDWSRSYLYHKILKELSEYYNIGAFEIMYKSKYGFNPRYKMDLLEEFLILSDTATNYIDFIFNELDEYASK